MGNLMLLTEMSAYSNAVQQYGKDAADFWSQYDFSPTKRYVKKMCDLFYKDKISQNEITKIFRGYQENAEWFDEMGVDFNKLTWEQLKELVLKQTGEYEKVSKLPNQFYVSDDGLITIGYFNTFEEAMNFEPQNGWCTSVNQGRFEEHHDINHEMLYIIRNNKLSKGSNCRFVVAQVNFDGRIVYWDQKNNNLNDGSGRISANEYETSLGDAKSKLQPMKLNNQLNCNTNMNKKLIRLTESDLHRIVKESVNRILMEAQSEGVQVRPYTNNVFAVGNNSGVKFYVDRNGRFYDGNMQPTKNVACLTDYDAQQVANQLNKALGNMFHYDMFRGGNSMQQPLTQL